MNVTTPDLTIVAAQLRFSLEAASRDLIREALLFLYRLHDAGASDIVTSEERPVEAGSKPRFSPHGMPTRWPRTRVRDKANARCVRI
jgi:hypothetical protein